MHNNKMLPLWPPGALSLSSGVSEPSLTYYRPAPHKSTGAAMIICPGGGYAGLADHEGEPVARLFSSWGITAFVLRYRLGPHSRHPDMLDDAAQALRIVRESASEWVGNPDSVGILGFSAGGHLASTLATHYRSEIERPSLAALIYPVITLQEPYAHLGSRQMLLGDSPSAELIESLSNHLHVTEQTPPCFIVHSADDTGVPVENSLMLASALSRAHIPYALHVFGKGGHGYGLAENDPDLRIWPELLHDWLRGQHFCS